MDIKIRVNGLRLFTKEEKHRIIQEFLSGSCSKREIWQKYTGEIEEHGNLLKWMRQLGYESTNVVSSSWTMPKKVKPGAEVEKQEESFENLQLKKRIAELEKQLKDAELKAIAFSTMVDIAEKEFKIPIRKKLNTKL